MLCEATMSTSTNAPATPGDALPLPPQLPSWYEEYLLVYTSGQAHAFILSGDSNAYAYQALTHRNTLIAGLMGKRQVVIVYDRAVGIMFPDDGTPETKDYRRMRIRATALLGTPSARAVVVSAADYGAVALGAAGSAPAQPNDPFGVGSVGAALQVLEQLLLAPDAKDQVAVVIQGADLICPDADKGMMADEGRDVLARLRSWGSRRDIGDQNNPIFLLTNTLPDLHTDLRAASSGYYTLRIPMPDRAARLAYLQWYMAWREADEQPISLVGVTLPELASTTGGLTLRGVEDILLRGARTGGVAPALVRQRKDQIIASEYTQVARMLDPLPGGFRTFSGRQDIKQWSRAELIAPIHEGRLAHALKGVLFVGPPGCGKCIKGDSLIVTNKGIMPIQDVPRYFYVDPVTNEVAGLRVQSVTPAGETMQAPASHWWDMGVSDTIRITTEVGLEVEGTPEHPVLVACADGVLRWKPLRDIEVGDWLPIKQGDGVFGHDRTLDTETAYIFGLLTGDGNLTHGGQIRLTSADPELIEAFGSYIQQRYGDVPLLHGGHARARYLAAYDYVVQAWQIKAEFIRKGLSTALAFDKTIPITVLQAPMEIQAAFLQGLFDADGSVSDSGFEYGTSSELLARQVSAILWNMGIAHVIGRRSVNDKTRRISFRVLVSGMGLPQLLEMIGFRLARKAERLRSKVAKMTNDSRVSLDRIPYMASLFARAIDEFAPPWNQEPGVRKMMYGVARRYSATITRGTLSRVVAYGEQRACTSPALMELRRIRDAGLFFTQVVAKRAGQAHVYDLTVPDSHSFVANSLVSHNTFFARALAAELGGWSVVAFRPEKIEQELVGRSERNMEMFWDFCIALSPTLILFDEIDQTNVSRRGTNSGNPVASNLFNQMLDRMSDETLRGKIVGLFASNRPDLIDPALLRFGRMDAIIPFLLPEADERAGVLQSQAAMQGVRIESDALTRLTAGTEGATQSDLAAYIAKARRLAERSGSDAITVAEADLALRYIRATSPAVADFYTLLAVNACTDSEFLPERYAQKLSDRQQLADEIEQAADRAQMPIPTPRRARSW